MTEIERYKNWLLINGASQNTVINYLSRLKKFFAYTNTQNINQEIINQFFLYLKETHSPSSINTFKYALHSYFILFKKIDMELPKNHKVEKTDPEFITKEFFEKEIIPLVEKIFRSPLQVKAILYFMFFTGIRRSDIEKVIRNDIDLEKRTAQISMQKTKERITVMFTDKAKKVFKEYFNSEPEETNAFNTTSIAVKKMFEKMNKHCKEKNLYPHLFRHSSATHMLDCDMNILSIQKLLGHRSINSTMRYAHINMKKIKEEYDQKVNKKEGKNEI